MTKSIFIPHHFSASDFNAADLSVNFDPETYSDYVYSGQDTAELFGALQAFGVKHGIAVPNYDLCDKQKATAKFAAAGFATFATVAVNTRADLENFPHDPIILKPSVSFNTSSTGHTLDAAMYCVRTKAELLAQLDALGAFVGSLTTDEPFIAQQVADGNEDKYAALILSGVVNGQGEIWHCPSLELNTYFKDKVRKVQSVWSEENNTEETAALQSCVDALLSAENTKNCFYQMQFLRAGGMWVPHDFQFRMTYYVNGYLIRTPYAFYREALIKYAFDAANEKPALPRSFGLHFYPDPVDGRPPVKNFVHRNSKADVLASFRDL